MAPLLSTSRITGTITTLGAYRLAFISPSLIADAFNQYYSASEIQVDQVIGTQLCDSVVFTIFFLGVQNPLPIQIDASGAVIQIDASGAVAEG